MEKLSLTLKNLLNKANISEAELARRTGIAQPMVNRLATGKNKNPKLETLKPIAKYFSVTFSQLLGEEDLPLSSARENDLSNENSNVYQLPLLDWNNLNLTRQQTQEKIIATTAKVSNDAFAILVNDSNLEPRFPSRTLLTIDPSVEYNNNDFVLIENTATNKSELFQVKLSESSTELLNIANSQSSVFNQGQHKVLGVLVQTRYDYK